MSSSNNVNRYEYNDDDDWRRKGDSDVIITQRNNNNNNQQQHHDNNRKRHSNGEYNTNSNMDRSMSNHRNGNNMNVNINNNPHRNRMNNQYNHNQQSPRKQQSQWSPMNRGLGRGAPGPTYSLIPPPPPSPHLQHRQIQAVMTNSAIPPPPPFPPRNYDNDHYHPTTNNNNQYPHQHSRNTGSRNPYHPSQINKSKGNKDNSPPSVLVLKGVPPNVSWQDISQYLTHEFQVQVRFVKIIPSSSSDENHNYCTAYVKVATREQALSIFNAWKQEEEGTNGGIESTKRKRKKWILNHESITIVGLHDSNSIPLSSSEEISSSSSRTMKTEYQNPNQSAATTSHHEPREKRPRFHPQNDPQQQQYNLLLQRQKQISNQLNSLNTKKELIHKQETSLQKQINLHKKMLTVMEKQDDVTAATQKTKKMKEILELQKKVNGLKKELLGIMEEIEALKQEEKESVATIALMDNRGKGYHQSHHNRGATKQQYSLDKRTTILKVEGLGIQQQSNKNGNGAGGEGDLENSEDMLVQIMAHFEAFGHITDVKWLESEESTDQNHSILLLNCSNRVVAERIMNDGSNFNDLTLSFSWYDSRKQSEKGGKRGEDSGYDNSGGQGEESVIDEIETTWADDDEAMIDYDYNEEEDD